MAAASLGQEPPQLAPGVFFDEVSRIRVFDPAKLEVRLPNGEKGGKTLLRRVIFAGLRAERMQQVAEVWREGPGAFLARVLAVFVSFAQKSWNKEHPDSTTAQIAARSHLRCVHEGFFSP